jgi:hypothetical protein
LDYKPFTNLMNKCYRWLARSILTATEKAADRIIRAMRNYFGIAGEPVEEFAL